MRLNRAILGRKLHTLAAIRFPSSKTKADEVFRKQLTDALVEELTAFAEGMARELNPNRRIKLIRGAAKYLALLMARASTQAEQRGVKTALNGIAYEQAKHEAALLREHGSRLN